MTTSLLRRYSHTGAEPASTFPEVDVSAAPADHPAAGIPLPAAGCPHYLTLRGERFGCNVSGPHMTHGSTVLSARWVNVRK